MCLRTMTDASLGFDSVPLTQLHFQTIHRSAAPGLGPEEPTAVTVAPQAHT